MPDPFSAPTISAITEDPTTYPMTMPSDPPSVKRQLEAMANDGDNLDLKRNDNAYHVIASIVADRIEYETQHGKDAEADEVMNSLLPFSLQVSFAEATEFRMGALPAQADIMGESSVDALVRKCKGFQPAAQPQPAVAPAEIQQATPAPVPLMYMQSYPAPAPAAIIPTNATGYYQPPKSLMTNEAAPVSPTKTADERSVATRDTRITEAHAANIQSKARQQLIAEIEESKRLMESATTDEAALFWKKHLDVLYASMERLTAGNNNNNGSVDQQTNNRKEEIPAASNNDNAPQDPPNNANAAKSDFAAGPGKKVWVIAPANLPGGYRFEAQLDDRKFLATVPPGGVVKGQTFLTEYRDLDRIVMSVPVGKWRDGICDCFAAGICHPMLLTTFICPLLSLGQIMTRSRLTWTGSSGPLVETRMTYTSMWIILLSYVALNIVFIALPLTKENPFMTEDDEIDWMEVGPILGINVCFMLYSLCTITRARTSIKDKYAIPNGVCGDVEDCCCAMLCQPCAICQMGRHTADFDTFRGVCCSSTGLSAKVECPDGPAETMALYGDGMGSKQQQLV